jgi:NTE family protein
VLFALADAGIPVDAIAGTSIGALVGALWATGQLEVFERGLRGLELSDLISYVDPVWPRAGLLSGERATEYLRGLIGDWRIEDLPIPFAAVAVDLVTGEEMWIRTGRLLDAVRASISVPGIFVPVRQGARLLVDGALRNPVPVAALEPFGVDVKVAVNLHAQPLVFTRVPQERRRHLSVAGGMPITMLARYRRRPRARSTRSRAAGRAEPDRDPHRLDERARARDRAAPTGARAVDVVLAPDVRGIRSFEFHKGPRAVAAGRKELESKLPEIRAALAKRPRLARYFSLGSSS